MVKAPNWLAHLEKDWSSPVYGHWLVEGARGHRLIRADMRGFGLSDWDPPEFNYEAMVGDLATVIDAAGSFVELDSANHILLGDEPAWPVFTRELRAFLAA